MTPALRGPSWAEVAPGLGRGAVAAAAARAALGARPPGGAPRWERTNHRGATVTLLGGLAAAVGATVAAVAAPGLGARHRVAAAVAGGVSAALGALDDDRGTASARGLRGHASAVLRGEVTTGALKVLGIGAAGLLAGALVRGDSHGTGHRSATGTLFEVGLAGGVVAGTANLVNLLDLRPGRALKAALLLALVETRHARTGAPGLGPCLAGTALVAMPADLAEATMLGDAGANALGALLGLAAAQRCSRRGLVLRLGVLVALTAASERVSFTRVIAATPGLRELDALGRLR